MANLANGKLSKLRIRVNLANVNYQKQINQSCWLALIGWTEFRLVHFMALIRFWILMTFEQEIQHQIPTLPRYILGFEEFLWSAKFFESLRMRHHDFIKLYQGNERNIFLCLIGKKSPLLEHFLRLKWLQVLELEENSFQALLFWHFFVKRYTIKM